MIDNTLLAVAILALMLGSYLLGCESGAREERARLKMAWDKLMAEAREAAAKVGQLKDMLARDFNAKN